MSCPPGTVLNPRTFRCVQLAGRTAQKLVKRGDIGDYLQVNPEFRRRTVRAPRYKQPMIQAACEPGTYRNPATGRCIKVGGKTFKRLYRNPVAPPPQQYPAPALRYPVAAPRQYPATQKQIQQRRKTSSNGPLKLPVGTASPAPFADRSTIMGWMSQNCQNNRDPITGTPFATVDTSTLQDVVRLHDSTCTLAAPLNTVVAAQHREGKVATIPGDPTSPMTLDDFTALRDTMRRRNPAYKIPGRRHQPPPPNWKLYIASDNRSGPDFASVMFVDVTKVIQTAAGVQYPLDSVVLDLGFIPLNIMGASCSPRTIVDLIQQLATANRLLTPVAGGWKPVAGFPFRRSYWKTPDAKERLNRLCRDLAKALATPL